MEEGVEVGRSRRFAKGGRLCLPLYYVCTHCMTHTGHM